MTSKRYFVTYVMGFYGPRGLYPIVGVTRSKIGQLTSILKLKHFDSVDREMIREALLENANTRGLVDSNRSESITLFNEGKASTFYRNARGRCEDAPCCGCCTI